MPPETLKPEEVRSNVAIRAHLEIELAPFRVPKDVDVTNRPLHEEPRSVSLKKLSPEALEALCDQFRTDVFAAAGKQPPVANEEARRCRHCGGYT